MVTVHREESNGCANRSRHHRRDQIPPIQHTIPPKKAYQKDENSLVPSESMLMNLIKLLPGFRGTDFVRWLDTHDILYREARRTREHGEVTAHYYSVMSGVIEQYYGGSFHFVPPAHPRQTRKEASVDLHRLIARILNHTVGKHALDIGCGIGTAMVDVARWGGGKLTGITVSPNEVERGNRLMWESGVGSMCKLIEGDANVMTPLDDEAFDSAYAIYALKYFSDLKPVFAEVKRILKPGGLFLIYDLVKTDVYDEKNDDHRAIIGGLEYACGMPPLHTNAEMKAVAETHGLLPVAQMDIGKELPWYYTFSCSPLFIWLINSPLVYYFFRMLEIFRIVPSGFADFERLCLSGTVSKLVKGGEAAILTGSNILVFQKQDDLEEVDPTVREESDGVEEF